MSLKRATKPAVMHTVGHTTPATAHMIASRNGTRSSGTPTKRRTSSRASKPAGSRASKRTSSSRKPSGGAVILKAGSSAAKAWGKKMAALRKKKAK